MKSVIGISAALAVGACLVSAGPSVAQEKDCPDVEPVLAGTVKGTMVVIEVVGVRTAVDGANSSALEADKLRQRYRVSSDEAAALLIGKDGGVKLRLPGAISANRLFETIDAMTAGWSSDS